MMPPTRAHSLSLRRVCKIMHVKTPQDHEHNIGNQTLLEGARRLGYLCKSVPQNITGTFAAHKECGASCTAGCRGRGEADDVKTGRSGKMSGERAFLDEFLHLDPESAENGRKRNKVTVDILDKFDVERIVFEETLGAAKKAVGVMGTVKAKDGTLHKAFIKANRVVVAAGTLNSPCILLRSGLKVSYPIRQLARTCLTILRDRILKSGRTCTCIQHASSCPSGTRKFDLGKATS